MKRNAIIIGLLILISFSGESLIFGYYSLPEGREGKESLGQRCIPIKWYQYEYVRTMQNTKKPYNTYLWIETTYGSYFIDSANLLVVLKTTDEGVTVSTVTTRTNGVSILSSWYDRTNERLYFLETDDTQEFWAFYIELDNSDNIVEMGTYDYGVAKAAWWAADLFLIGGVLYATVSVEATDMDIFKYTAPNWNRIVNEAAGGGSGASPITLITLVGANGYHLYSNTDDDQVKMYYFDSTAENVVLKDTLAGYTLNNDYGYGGRSMAYDGDDSIYCILRKTADSKDYLCTYSIADTEITVGAEYNVILMANRQTATGKLEKGFHITSYFAYQISREDQGSNLVKIADLNYCDTPPTNAIIAIGDTYAITDGAKLYKWQNILSRTNTANCVLEIQEPSRAGLRTTRTLGQDVIVELFDDSDALLHRGKQFEEIGWGNEREYIIHGLDWEVNKPLVTLDYSTAATEVATIAKAAIDLYAYVYYDASSIPNSAITTKGKWDKEPLPEVLDELADRIDGIWYIEPDGKIWLLKITSRVDSTITITQASTDVSSPIYHIVNQKYNYIHLFGAGYIESDGDSKDAADILINGPQELIRVYAGCTDLTQLQNIAAALLTRDGIATPPLTASFIRTNTSYIQPGKYLSLQWTHINYFSAAVDFNIKEIMFKSDNNAIFIIGNSLFQQGREYIQEPKPKVRMWDKWNELNLLG